MQPPRRKSIGPQGLPGRRGQVGIGYVVLPDDEDRTAFILRCLRSGTVMLRTENTELIRDVKIGVLALQLVEFPATSKELGSCVGWVKMPRHEKPLVFDVFTKQDELNPLAEHEFLLSKDSAAGTASVAGNGHTGMLGLHAESFTESGGQVHVTVRNKNKSGKLRIQVQGTAETHVEGELRQTATGKIVTEAVSGRKAGRTTHEPTQITHQAEKVVHGGGKEPVTLADACATFLGKFVDQVAAITVTTALGQMPILNLAQVQALKAEINTIKSKLSFTD